MRAFLVVMNLVGWTAISLPGSLSPSSCKMVSLALSNDISHPPAHSIMTCLFKLAPNSRPGQTQNVLTCVESSSSKSLVLERDSSWQTHPFPQSQPHKRRNKIRANLLDQTELFVLEGGTGSVKLHALEHHCEPWPMKHSGMRRGCSEVPAWFVPYDGC